MANEIEELARKVNLELAKQLYFCDKTAREIPEWTQKQTSSAHGNTRPRLGVFDQTMVERKRKIASMMSEIVEFDAKLKEDDKGTSDGPFPEFYEVNLFASNCATETKLEFGAVKPEGVVEKALEVKSERMEGLDN